jgi:hypothetical protein
VPTYSTSGAGAARHTGLVSRTLPEPIAEQVLAFPEWRMGAQRIKVTLADGRTFAPVDVAWGREIVRVADDEEVPLTLKMWCTWRISQTGECPRPRGRVEQSDTLGTLPASTKNG